MDSTDSTSSMLTGVAEAKRKHDEAKAAHSRGEVPDEVYLQRLDELEELQRKEAVQTQLRQVLQGNMSATSLGYSDLLISLGRQTQPGLWITGLKVRGETADELAGGAKVLRAKVARVRAPSGAIDIVGTGGDHHGTYNVSSCSALVVAGAGVPVAKHGNRAFTSKSGSADVLGELGINLDLPIETLEKALAEASVCFLMAPRHHGAMRNVAGPRVELAPSRTIFNLLGPMSNPALVSRQLVGVFDRRWLKPVAQALGQLGLDRVLVVHGQDGIIEYLDTKLVGLSF